MNCRQPSSRLRVTFLLPLTHSSRRWPSCFALRLRGEDPSRKPALRHFSLFRLVTSLLRSLLDLGWSALLYLHIARTPSSPPSSVTNRSPPHIARNDEQSATTRPGWKRVARGRCVAAKRTIQLGLTRLATPSRLERPRLPSRHSDDSPSDVEEVREEGRICVPRRIVQLPLGGSSDDLSA